MILMVVRIENILESLLFCAVDLSPDRKQEIGLAVLEILRMMLMSRFCIFFQNNPDSYRDVNYHMQVSEETPSESALAFLF
jgi:hypothetical protein